MHNGFVTIEGEKMSKSLGNIILVRELTDSYHGEVIRLALLSSHYRQGLDWNEKVIYQANKLLTKLYEIKDGLDEIDASNKTSSDLSVIEKLMDDLNTPGLIADLNKIVKDFNSDNGDKKVIKEKLSLIGSVLGILQDNSFNNISNELKIKVEKMISERDEAKNNKDYNSADKIRQQLLDIGIEINDTSDGTVWKVKT